MVEEENFKQPTRLHLSGFFIDRRNIRQINKMQSLADGEMMSNREHHQAVTDMNYTVSGKARKLQIDGFLTVQ